MQKVLLYQHLAVQRVRSKLCTFTYAKVSNFTKLLFDLEERRYPSFLVGGGGKKPIMLMQTVLWITWSTLPVFESTRTFKALEKFQNYVVRMYWVPV